MISPYFNQEHELFRDSVRQFVESTVIPGIPDWERDEKIPRDIFRQMGDLGFLGINFPEKYGGTDNDFFYSVAYMEELSKSASAGFCAAVCVHQYMATAHILNAGSEELKQKYLPKSISGEYVGGLAISEPNAGSDVANIQTKAVRDGDHYIINGSKTFITNGVYGNFVTLACKTQPDAGAAGISLIVVDTEAEGFSATKLKKMGWYCSDTAEIALQDVRVPVSNRIGAENQGFYYIMDSFQLERLTAAIMSVAGAEKALEVTLKYINEREAFGRQLKKFQVIRHQLADLATEIEAAKQLVYSAAYRYDNKEFAVKECSMAKLYTSELGKKVADVCLQCFGGYGYMEEYPIARMYRDARVATIVGGTSEIMREIISKVVVDNTAYEPAYGNTAENESRNDIFDNSKTTQTMSKPEKASEIIESLPQRFKPEKAEGVNTTFHFDIAGENGGQYTVNIADGTCTVEQGHQGEANCVVTTKDKVYEDVELGRTNPQMAVMMGKIKISNLGEMMKFINYFERIS